MMVHSLMKSTLARSCLCICSDTVLCNVISKSVKGTIKHLGWSCGGDDKSHCSGLLYRLCIERSSTDSCRDSYECAYRNLSLLLDCVNVEGLSIRTSAKWPPLAARVCICVPLALPSDPLLQTSTLQYSAIVLIRLVLVEFAGLILLQDGFYGLAYLVDPAWLTVNSSIKVFLILMHTARDSIYPKQYTVCCLTEVDVQGM